MSDRGLPENSWGIAAVKRLQCLANARQHAVAMGATSSPPGASALSNVGVCLRHAQLLNDPDAIIETTALVKARAFRASPSLWCLSLLGAHGAGKTFAAEWILADAVGAGITVADGQSRLLGPSELRDAAYDYRVRLALKKYGALVLDDLGSEGQDQSGHLNGVLFEVLNHRWRAEKLTVITSNLSPSRFRERYGRRITDRILHGGRAISVSGPDLRAQSAISPA